MAEDKLWNVNTFFFVHCYWNALAIVPNCDLAPFLIDCYLDHGHLFIPVIVIRRVNQDFVCIHVKFYCAVKRAYRRFCTNQARK